MSHSHSRLVVVFLAVGWAGPGGAQEAPREEPNDQAQPVTVTPPPTEAERADAARKLLGASPEPLPASHPPIAAWVNGEGFRIQSPDGNWRLRVGLQMAPIYQPLFQKSGNNWANFGFDYARPRIDGFLLRPWLQYWCSLEFRTFPPFLLDCFIDAKPWSFFGIRAGQFSTPLSRHEYRRPQEVLFPDWATTADYFWTGRDRGVLLYGETKYIDYYVSFTAGTTLTQTISTPGNFQLIGRVSANPLGPVGPTEMPYVATDDPVPFRFSFTAQGAWGRVNPNGVGFNPDAFFQRMQQGERDQALGAVDLLVQGGRLELFGEFYGRRIEPRDVPTSPFVQYGAWAQAHVTFYRRILDFGVRFNWINPSTHLANDRFVDGEAQLAWFIFRTTLALRLRYAVANQQNPGPSPAADPNLLTTVGLPISPGTEHLLTVQVQLAL
jgi:hypothetical protein